MMLHKRYHKLTVGIIFVTLSITNDNLQASHLQPSLGWLRNPWGALPQGMTDRHQEALGQQRYVNSCAQKMLPAAGILFAAHSLAPDNTFILKTAQSVALSLAAHAVLSPLETLAQERNCSRFTKGILRAAHIAGVATPILQYGAKTGYPAFQDFKGPFTFSERMWNLGTSCGSYFLRAFDGLKDVAFTHIPKYSSVLLGAWGGHQFFSKRNVQQRNQALEREIATLDRANEGLVEERDSLKELSKTLQIVNRSYVEYAHNIAALNQELQQKSQALSHVVEVQKEKTRTLQHRAITTITQLDTEISSLQREIFSLRNEIAQRNQFQDLAASRVEQVEEDLNRAQQRIADLTQQVDQRAAELDALRSQGNSADIARIESELERLRVNHQLLHGDFMDAQDDVRSYQHALDQMGLPTQISEEWAQQVEQAALRIARNQAPESAIALSPATRLVLDRADEALARFYQNGNVSPVSSVSSDNSSTDLSTPAQPGERRYRQRRAIQSTSPWDDASLFEKPKKQ